MKTQEAQLLYSLFDILGRSQLSAIAKSTQFIRRERAFSAAQFLSFLFRQQSKLITSSLDSICEELGSRQIHITKSALNKRLDEKAVLFLKSVFEALLTAQLQINFPKLDQNIFRRIRIIDSTTIQLPDQYVSSFKGVHCASAKVQLEFDYLTQQFLYFQLQDGRTSDQACCMERLPSIQEDELILQDLGYYQLAFFEQLEPKGAFYLSKTKKDTQYYLEVENPPCHANGKYIEKLRYERLYMEKEIEEMAHGEYQEWPRLFIGRHKKLPVRCIVYRHTKEQEAQNQKREQRRRQKKSKQIHKTQFDALHGVTVYITNIRKEVTAEEIHQYYQLRWQIELLFKTWKSDLNVNSIKKVKIERWLCHFYTQSIVLLLGGLTMGIIRKHLKQKENIPISERMSIRSIAYKINRLLEVSWQSKISWYKYLHTLTDTLLRFCQKSLSSQCLHL